MNVILKTKFGSHLYGLETENSDTDYKGIYIPTSREIILGKAKDVINESTGKAHEKNTKDDVDYSIYSLKKFLSLACVGDAVAIDMLHSKENLMGHSYIWEYIQNRRTSFYSKDMSAYAGYVKKQCAKYGIKGSKISELEYLISFLNYVDLDKRVKEFLLPSGEHCFYEQKLNKSTNILEDFYIVNGKAISLNCKIKDVYTTANFQYEKYGERAKLAQKNENIDWKAVSHALRVSYQLKDIYLYGDFEYPLKESEYILKVKTGQLPYDNVSNVIENLFEEVTDLSQKSELPEKVDTSFWEDFLYEIYRDKIV